MSTDSEDLGQTLMLLQSQVHALEIVMLRTLVELEQVRPGLLDAVAGPVIFRDRPDAMFDEHLERVDDQISRLLIWARQYRGDPA